MTNHKMAIIVMAVLLCCSVEVGSVSAAAESKSYAPDNTAHNARDVQGGFPTPENQGKDSTDLKLTQQVRQAIMKDNSLSIIAKNIKIITVNGKVTLRGPVHTDTEKESISAKASTIAGPENVNNQLEVISK